MALEDQKTLNYLRRRCMWNIQISPLTIKITKLMLASYLFSFISAC